jgi:hypothetical protein
MSGQLHAPAALLPSLIGEEIRWAQRRSGRCEAEKWFSSCQEPNPDISTVQPKT